MLPHQNARPRHGVLGLGTPHSILGFVTPSLPHGPKRGKVGPTPATCHHLAWEVAQLAEGWPQVTTVTSLAAGYGHSLPDKG